MGATLAGILTDYAGRNIRLTDERREHILKHPEMQGMETAIADTLAKPEIVVRSLSDRASWLYHRYYRATPVGDKWLCVVVKIEVRDPFVITAYLTDKVKRGDVIWNAKR
jgi:hypothetical protein